MRSALPPWSFVLPLPLLLALCGCSLVPGLPGHAEWHAEVFPNVAFDDVFDVAYLQIDRDYDVQRTDRPTGSIESAWDFDSVSPVTRHLQRERVLAEVEAVEDGIELRLRVQTQVKERTGLLAPDDISDEGWTDARDDVQRAAVLFQRIHSTLVRGRPSPDFHDRPPVFPTDPEAGLDS